MVGCLEGWDGVYGASGGGRMEFSSWWLGEGRCGRGVVEGMGAY